MTSKKYQSYRIHIITDSNRENTNAFKISDVFDDNLETKIKHPIEVSMPEYICQWNDDSTIKLIPNASPVWIGMNGKVQIYESVPGYRNINSKICLGTQVPIKTSRIPVPYVFYMIHIFPNYSSLHVFGSLEPFRDIRQPVFSLPLSNIGHWNHVCLGEDIYDMSHIIPRFWGAYFNGDIRSTQLKFVRYMASQLFWTKKGSPRKVLKDNLNTEAIKILTDYRAFDKLVAKNGGEPYEVEDPGNSLYEFWGDDVINDYYDGYLFSHAYATALLSAMTLQEITNPVFWDLISTPGIMLHKTLSNYPYLHGDIGIDTICNLGSLYDNSINNYLCGLDIQNTSDIEIRKRLHSSRKDNKKALNSIKLHDLEIFYNFSSMQCVLKRISTAISQTSVAHLMKKKLVGNSNA